MDDQEEAAVAQRDWHTRARVRVLTEAASESISPSGVRRFQPGEETVMIQWGRKGYAVNRRFWWDSTDIDGAHLINARFVEVIAVLDEVHPY